jgi:hypothetical protein
MKRWPWLILVGVTAIYAALLATVGFPPWLSYGIHFARAVIVMAVLILYLPSIRWIFSSVPPPYRDFLLGGIILTEMSNTLFSVWNEAGRVFDVDTNVFTSPVSGFFSIVLALGGVAFLKAADTANSRRWAYALGIAILSGVGLVFVAPLFR